MRHWFLLPTLALGANKLQFLFNDCEKYCTGQNEYSFTFTKQACPAGGKRAAEGGFLKSECIEDDLTIKYIDVKGDQVTRKTTLDEAMMVCGNKKIVQLEDNKMWYSPEYEYRRTVLQCRDGHGDGQGWPGPKNCEDCDKPDKDAKADDVSYTSCLQAAYDKCVEDEPETERCIEARENNEEAYLCTFCKDCNTGQPKRTCFKYQHIYQSAAQSCFDDDSKSGYQACLKRAQEVLALRVAEREKICEKTFIIERTEIPCSQMGGQGYVACCCMVKGAMIQHPPEEECTDRAKFTECQTWKQLGYCKPNHGYYNYMSENCPLSCGICADVADSDDGGVGKSWFDLTDQIPIIKDEATYKKECLKAGVAQDEELCASLGGKYKKGECTPGKLKKTKCKKVKNAAVCRAFGCDITISGDNKTSCAGKPKNIGK